MTRKRLGRIFCLTGSLVWAVRPLTPQVNSGGVVAAPSAVVDFTNAGQTIPARKQASDPGTCTLGENYFNTTTGVLKVCTATNTWTNYAPPAGASGGIPYYSSANSTASSSTLSANSVVIGGGAGAAPKTTGVTIDASNNISTSGTLTTGLAGSAHGKLALGELPSNGATTAGWEAPDLVTSSLSLVFPNANPVANSFMLFPAPTGGQSQWSWGTFGNGLSVSGGTVSADSTVVLSQAAAQVGSPWKCTDAGSSGTTYSCTMTPSLLAYTDKQPIIFTPNTSCTGGTTTLNINNLGSKNIYKSDGTTSPAANDCRAALPMWLFFVGSMNSGSGGFLMR
ncbi:MAG: hypothetical protein LAP39_12625 [Acidobacteriia bacterium]|nr:hypothetical protein [Terriglobia bacterium]